MPDRSIVLFDGLCNLCDASVRFIIANDPAQRFAFAPLQSEEGRAVLARAVRDVQASGGSVVLVEKGRVYERSDAALRIATSLRFPWPLFGAFFALPQSVRDGLYGAVARNRYRWFGRRESCAIPTPETRARFL